MRRRRALEVLVAVVLVALVAPFVVYAVPQVVGADHSYVVLSGSMEPVLSPGDVVVVDDPNSGVGLVDLLGAAGLVHDTGSGISRGDVVTFRTSGDEPPTTHRVVEVIDEGGTAYRTKGDANEDPDMGLVRPSNVVGEVVLVLPYVGYVVQFGDTPAGFVALVVVPFGLLVASELYDAVASGGESGADGDGDGRGGDGRGGDGRGGDGDGRGDDGDGRGDGASGPGDGAAWAAVEGEAVAGPASPREAPAADGIDGTYSFSRGELRLALVLLVVVAPYAGWVAYTVQEAWAIAAAVAATLSLAFVVLAYTQTEPVPADGRPAPVERGPPATDGRERVPIDSLDSLLDLATDGGGDWLFADADGYVLPREHAVYVYASSDGADEQPRAAETPASDTPRGATFGSEGDAAGANASDSTDGAAREATGDPENGTVGDAGNGSVSDAGNGAALDSGDGTEPDEDGEVP